MAAAMRSHSETCCDPQPMALVGAGRRLNHRSLGLTCGAVKLANAAAISARSCPRTVSYPATIASISGSRYPCSSRFDMSRKLIPRSPIFSPVGTHKSAMTRIINSCNTRRCGRNATSSHKGRPVSWRSSVAEAKLVKECSDRNSVHRCRSSTGTCDWIPGFHGPKLMPTVGVIHYFSGQSQLH